MPIWFPFKNWLILFVLNCRCLPIQVHTTPHRSSRAIQIETPNLQFLSVCMRTHSFVLFGRCGWEGERKSDSEWFVQMKLKKRFSHSLCRLCDANLHQTYTRFQLVSISHHYSVYNSFIWHWIPLRCAVPVCVVCSVSADAAFSPFAKDRKYSIYTENTLYLSMHDCWIRFIGTNIQNLFLLYQIRRFPFYFRVRVETERRPKRNRPCFTHFTVEVMMVMVMLTANKM